MENENGMSVFDIKDKLANGKASIGSWMQIPSAEVAEIMGKAGYDWVAVDLEHGSFSRQILPDIFRALELGGTLPFARVAQSEAKDIKQALDTGARGIILPMIDSRRQLERAISDALYPPKGIRGVGYCRANLFGKHFSGYVEKDAKGIIFVAQIEHINGVIALDDILTVPGLSAIMVGPYDLSSSMGIMGIFEHPEFLETLRIIQEKAKFHNIPMGLHVVEPDEGLLQEKIAEGYQFIAYGTDAIFLYKMAECPNTLE